MHALNTLALLALFIAIHAVFLAALFALCADKVQQDDAATVSALRFQGVLYIGSNDKAVDLYRHADTNAVYYKQGVQFRSASTGRIVATQKALIGAF